MIRPAAPRFHPSASHKTGGVFRFLVFSETQLSTGMESIHIGTPPASFSCWESKTFYVHNFFELSDANGDDNVVLSPTFRCLGHDWTFDVYPGGVDDAEDGYVSVFLCNRSRAKVTIDYEILLKTNNGEGSKRYTKDSEGETFHAAPGAKDEPNASGDYDFFERAELKEKSSEYLVDGALVIELRMKLSEGSYQSKRYPRPLSTTFKTFADIFEDKDTCDVAFNVKGVPTIAHKCIIKSQAPDFYDMCETYSLENPMVIDDVDSECFEILMSYLYGGDVYPQEWQEDYEAILKAASKYGFASIKEEAEAWYLNSLEFTAENAIDKFMEADGNDFTVVRDAAKKFMIEHAEEIVKTEAFDRLHESLSLMKEIFVAAAQNSKKRKRDDE